MQVQFKLKDLNSQLSCTLCNGYFREAHTIPECMHTFCKICIFKHFVTNKVTGPITCPTCGTSLGPYTSCGSKVVFDRNLQSVVDKLFPFFGEEEKKAEDKFWIDHESKLKRSNGSESVLTKDLKRRKESPELTFHLVPIATTIETTLPALQKPCLKVPLSFKVSTVQKFIYKRLDENVQSGMKEQHLEIDILYNEEVIDPTGTLASLPASVAESQTPISLNYRKRKSIEV